MMNHYIDRNRQWQEACIDQERVRIWWIFVLIEDINDKGLASIAWVRSWWIFILIEDINDKKLTSSVIKILEWRIWEFSRIIIEKNINKDLEKSNLYCDKKINVNQLWNFLFVRQFIVVCWENTQMSYICRWEYLSSFAFFHVQLKNRL